MGRWQSDEDDEPRYASDARDEDEADDDELEGEWELDPNDPSHPDYDLSVDAGYAGWEATPRPKRSAKTRLLMSWRHWKITGSKRVTNSLKWFRPKNCTTTTHWNAWKKQ